MSECTTKYNRVRFEDIPGWSHDDHLAALQAFAKSHGRVVPADARAGVNDQLRNLIAIAASELSTGVTPPQARSFFEDNFKAFALAHEGPEGLLTGYYEPELDASRTPDGEFQIPIYRRPADLVNLIDENQRGANQTAQTHARQTQNGLQPMPTRQAIENGALAGQGLELAYLKDPVDSFFMHVQGSGLIRFADGTARRIGYSGKNGFPYTSIGRHLIESGMFPSEDMTLAALATWLRANPERARHVMWKNESYIFFDELNEDEQDGPLGTNRIALSAGRSLAVDGSHHAVGLPLFVDAPDLRHCGTSGPFRRLMIAQDAGSAITGPERGDIFFGTGEAASAQAGQTKHKGRFFALMPNDRRSLGDA